MDDPALAMTIPAPPPPLASILVWFQTYPAIEEIFRDIRERFPEILLHPQMTTFLARLVVAGEGRTVWGKPPPPAPKLATGKDDTRLHRLWRKFLRDMPLGMARDPNGKPWPMTAQEHQLLWHAPMLRFETRVLWEDHSGTTYTVTSRRTWQKTARDRALAIAISRCLLALGYTA